MPFTFSSEAPASGAEGPSSDGPSPCADRVGALLFPDESIVLRRPTRSDGVAIWRLVETDGALDRNSAYAYLLTCELFADSCLVAERAGRLAGFVTALVRPDRPDTLFVWQIGVAKEEQGRGLGKRLLGGLLERAPPGLRWLEATVAPSNAASAALFRSIARARGASCAEEPLFDAALFPGGGHEDEPMLRIGPLTGA